MVRASERYAGRGIKLAYVDATKTFGKKGRMPVGVVIQARMSSTRYPGKVLYGISGKPMLGYLLESLCYCKSKGHVVVATSNTKSDDPIEKFCSNMKVDCYRGSLDNVAQRFVEVIKAYKFSTFVRVSGDSPLLDYRLVDKALGIFQSGHFDLVTNTLKRTFPKGQSVEILDSATFVKAYNKMLAPDEQEHVTRYFYTHNNEFTIHNFESGKAYGDIELSVNTPEDMRRIESIIHSMVKPHWEYNFEELLELMSR